MISLDYKKRPSLKKVLESSFIVSNKLKKPMQSIEKENTFSERRYEKMKYLRT